MKPARRLADHLSTPLGEPALSAQRAELTKQIHRQLRRQRQQRWAVAAATLVFAVSGGLFLGSQLDPAQVIDPTTAETGPVPLELPDGTLVRVPDGKLKVRTATAQAIELHLEAGEAIFDVQPHLERPFSIIAGEYSVHVLGTRFEMKLNAAQELRLVVHEGRVEVVHQDSGRRWSVLAGSTWQSPKTPPSAASTKPPRPRTSEPKGAAAPADARDPAPAPSTVAPEEGPQTTDAAAELALAQQARLAGNYHLAASRFAGFLKHHPKDSRAALAAFELGRLRLDRMGDPQAALRAFDRALSLGPGATLREDATARRIDALARLGAPSRCREAVRQYLKRYPEGVHRRRLESVCPE